MFLPFDVFCDWSSSSYTLLSVIMAIIGKYTIKIKVGKLGLERNHLKVLVKETIL
jgi:hypothetical protein